MKRIYKVILAIVIAVSVSLSTVKVIGRVTNEVVTEQVKPVKDTLPACMQLYNYITFYCDSFNIPHNIGLGMAFYETNYRGPFDWGYDPAQTSPHKAYGAMQIKVGTANLVSDTEVTKYDLLNNLELNVYLALKHLSGLKTQYHTWTRALGAYNTGKPIVNKYAIKISRFDPKKRFKWIINRV